MLYRFKSQAAAEVIFLREAGEELLSMLGKAASPEGVITLADMPAAIHTLKQAMQTKAGVATPTSTTTMSTTASNPPPTPDDDPAHTHVNFHQRLLPMIDLLQQSLVGQKDVVWGA